jgi:hypothetical protein
MLPLLDLPQACLHEVVERCEAKDMLALFKCSHSTRMAVLQAVDSLTIEQQAKTELRLLPALALVDGVRYSKLKLAAFERAPAALVPHIPALLLSGHTKELELTVRGCRASIQQACSRCLHRVVSRV